MKGLDAAARRLILNAVNDAISDLRYLSLNQHLAFNTTIAELEASKDLLEDTLNE